MPLIVSSLESQIKAAFRAAGNANGKDAEDILAAQLAVAIDTFVKSGTVTTAVVTAGSPTAQTGVGTGAVL